MHCYFESILQGAMESDMRILIIMVRFHNRPKPDENSDCRTVPL